MYHGRFKGTHYAAGFKYGTLLRTHGNVITQSPTFEITGELRDFAAECLPLYRRYYPEVVEEIQGMADGQQTSLETLTALLFPMYCFRPDHHCTCFATAREGQVYLCKNSDFLVSIEKLYMNCLYALDGVYAFNGNTTAFIQMEDGINSRGLAVGLTFVYPHLHKPGLNAGMLNRYLLEKCATTGEAIAALRELPIASAQTLTLADHGGHIAVVECNPERVVVIEPEEGECFVATANDFNSPELREYRAPAGLDTWRADERLRVARAALRGQNDLTLDYLQSILAGKHGFMCQYDRRANADTVWSAVYDCTSTRVWRVEGNPMRKPFVEDTRGWFK